MCVAWDNGSFRLLRINHQEGPRDGTSLPASKPSLHRGCSHPFPPLGEGLDLSAGRLINKHLRYGSVGLESRFPDSRDEHHNAMDLFPNLAAWQALSLQFTAYASEMCDSWIYPKPDFKRST